MRLGIGSYTYTWAVGVPGHLPAQPMGAHDLLERARHLGVNVVQIADNLPLHQLPQAGLEELDHRARELGISVEVGTRGIDPKHLARYIEIASRFRSRILRVVVDTSDHHPDENEIVELVKAVLPELQCAGICLAIENHDRFPVRALARIVERIGSARVGICLDTVNSFGALEGPDTVIETLGPWTVNLHVKDFSIERVSHAMGFVIEGRPAGSGRLNVPWLLERLRALGRDPNAILELWTPPGATLEATIASEAEWAEESIRYLRSLIPE
jgi:sugar phosphate isomerase/epimerase